MQRTAKRRLLSRIVLIGALTAGVAVGVHPAAAAPTTFTVSSTADGGPGSLRQAILDANATPDTDRIAFDTGGASPFVVQPATPLPTITSPVILDATVTGSCASGGQGVALDGSLLGSGVNYQDKIGLKITAGASTVRGLAIGNFSAAGVHLESGGGNTIECDAIGLNATLTAAAENDNGIDIRSSANTLIGGASPEQRNIISGNANGLQISGSGANGTMIAGNYIGTTVDGSAAIPNFNVGVNVSTSSDNTQVLNNVISGNYYGIEIANATNVIVQGNLVGTDASGENAVANGGLGIEVNQSPGTLIGGPNTGEGNVVSNSQAGEGVRVFWSPGSEVVGNLIGTDASGTQPMGNLYGVTLLDTTNTLVGGNSPGSGNVIANSTYIGVWVTGCLGPPPNCSSPADQNMIQGNHIGTDLTNTRDFGNGRAGIQLQTALHTMVGGSGGAGAPNVIAFNEEGILVTSQSAGNRINGNAIDFNDGLGIDLGSPGVTPNDASDVDTGPNGLQNFPVVTGATTNGAATNVDGTISSAAGTSYLIDVYASPGCDPSSYGEGRRYLGSTTALTDGGGNAIFSTSFATGVAAGWVVTTTATVQATGDSSEFSACRTVVSSGPDASVSIDTLTPPYATAGSGDLAVTIDGSGFDNTSVVTWNGAPLNTTYGSATELTADVTSSELASAGTATVQVTNQSTGAVSNLVTFYVNEASATVTASDSSSNSDPFGSATASTGSDGVSAAANGTGTISVAQYDTNPLTADPPDGVSSFFDVHGAAGNDFSSLTLVDCDLSVTNTTHTVYWFDGSEWAPVDPQSYDSGTGCVTITLDNLSSVPSIAFLSGTVMAVGPVPPEPPPPDTTAPVVTVTSSPSPSAINTTRTVAATADDTGTGGSNVASARYSINGGSPVTIAAPADGAYDEPSESLSVNVSSSTAAVWNLCIEATDAAGNSGSSCKQVIWFDPKAYVTGSGTFTSPAGASTTTPNASGKSSFAIDVKYAKGKTTPSGTPTQVVFKAGDFNFVSTAFDWLVISGAQARYQGRGTINGTGDYAFLVRAVDGQLAGGGGVDRFRLRVWNRTTNAVVYDNQTGAAETATPPAVTGGNLAIHR